MTTPFVGGLLSTITPSDVTDVHKSAVLQAVIVVKYRIPGPRWIWQSVKSIKKKNIKCLSSFYPKTPERYFKEFLCKTNDMVYCTITKITHKSTS